MTQQPGNNQPQAGAPGRLVDPDCTADERTYALFLHLSLLGHFVLPVFSFVITVILWQVKKSESPFLDDHGREATNFQLSYAVYTVILAVLGALTCGIGWLVLSLLFIPALIGMVFAAVAANRGEFYRYPMTIRMLS